jgi:drug/metabolite transporter (DMT)-like permease
MTPYLLLIINVLLLVTGQFLWKIAVTPIDNWNLPSFIQVALSPYFILGGILYVAATGIWLVILSKLPLSIAYPIQSLSYVLGLIGAYFIFKESINMNQIIGIILILGGVFFIAK